MLIDSTYFVGELQLTSVDLAYILENGSRYETELLRKCLGYSLAKLVLSYSVSSGQRIKDIVEGKEYTDTVDGEEVTMYWAGLAHSGEKSPLAYYVYSNYLNNDSKHKSGIGMSQPDAENSIIVDPSFQIITTWNEARELMGYYGQDKDIPSLYNFLMTCEDDETYPELSFKELNFINPFFI